MRQIGVRELKARLSGILKLVGEGEEVLVTRRGAPIATIVPVGTPRSDPAWRRLVADGRVTPAARPRRRTVGRPIDTGRSASEFVLEEREADR